MGGLNDGFGILVLCTINTVFFSSLTMFVTVFDVPGSLDYCCKLAWCDRTAVPLDKKYQTGMQREKNIYQTLQIG